MPNKKLELTQLEIKVFDWYLNNLSSVKLINQVKNIQITNREYTGHGFYSDIIVPDAIADLDDKDTIINPIDGPIIKGPDIDVQGETILFIENRRINLLEIYSYGDSFPEKPQEFYFEHYA